MTSLRVPSGVDVPLEIARSARARQRGLLGRDSIDGALWLPRTRHVHSFGMRFAIDVVCLDRSLRVVAVAEGLPPGRLGPWRWSTRSVVEAVAGSVATWGIAVGDVLEPPEV